MYVIQVAKRKYQQEYDIAPSITFGGDHVALDIPDEQKMDGKKWMANCTTSEGSCKLINLFVYTSCLLK